MILLAAFIIASLTSGVVPRNINKDLDLKLVHVIFRHGARTPADTYPNDPYLNHDFKPFGWGQLTNKGKLQMFDTGKFLRDRYDVLLGKEFKLDDVHAQCTDVSRTKMSLQLLLAGLFPPQETSMEWNKNLNWQPIPYSYEPLNQDSLLLVRVKCPRYHEELENVFDKEVAETINTNAQLFKNLSSITGLSIKTPDDVQSLFSTLQAESEYGVKLPEWTRGYYPDKLRPLTDASFIFNAFNDELKKLKGGPFIKKCVDDWEKKSEGKLKTKIMLFAGHDATVTNILLALKVWESQLPDYGITTMLEFSQHAQTGQFGVEVYLRNSTSVDPYPLTIPGCAQFCPLDQLKKLLASVIPADFNEECKAKNVDFTEPPATGPSPTTNDCTHGFTVNAFTSFLSLTALLII